MRKTIPGVCLSLQECLDETESLIGEAAQADPDRWNIRNYPVR
jgi:hypothetical protein